MPSGKPASWLHALLSARGKVRRVIVEEEVDLKLPPKPVSQQVAEAAARKAEKKKPEVVPRCA